MRFSLNKWVCWALAGLCFTLMLAAAGGMGFFVMRLGDEMPFYLAARQTRIQKIESQRLQHFPEDLSRNRYGNRDEVITRLRVGETEASTEVIELIDIILRPTGSAEVGLEDSELYRADGDMLIYAPGAEWKNRFELIAIRDFSAVNPDYTPLRYYREAKWTIVAFWVFLASGLATLIFALGASQSKATEDDK